MLHELTHSSGLFVVDFWRLLLREQNVKRLEFVRLAPTIEIGVWLQALAFWAVPFRSARPGIHDCLRQWPNDLVDLDQMVVVGLVLFLLLVSQHHHCEELLASQDLEDKTSEAPYVNASAEGFVEYQLWSAQLQRREGVAWRASCPESLMRTVSALYSFAF